MTTTREEAGRAVEILRGSTAHLYGAVINMAPTKGPGAYRYGYYGYGYAANQSATGSTPPSRGGKGGEPSSSRGSKPLPAGREDAVQR